MTDFWDEFDPDMRERDDEIEKLIAEELEK